MAESGRPQPVLMGLVALVAVSAVVGLIAAAGALLGTRALGIGGDTASEPPRASAMYLPAPRPSERPRRPAPSTGPADEAARARPADSERPRRRTAGITLTASPDRVPSFGRINLTGSYRGGEGAILRVQRLEGGSWQDFPVTVSVSGGTFSTYVQTSRVGVNRFRVADTDRDATSNQVLVVVG